MEEASKLIVCALLTLLLLISELVTGQFSHCLTLQAITNQSLYNLLTLTSAIVALKVFTPNLTILTGSICDFFKHHCFSTVGRSEPKVGLEELVWMGPIGSGGILV